MKIKVIGAGIYGCHIALSLIEDGHEVEIHEKAGKVFAGASGGIPARLHAGALHYPRSYVTSQACLAHKEEFNGAYGKFTRAVPVNIYAIAKHDSLVDFQTYRHTVKSQLEAITIENPKEFGLRNVEGALLTGERHLVIRELAYYFSNRLKPHFRFNSTDTSVKGFDYVIDCTFCAKTEVGVDRYEPCITVLLDGPTDKSVTIMDGPFPSLYVWDEEQSLCSLTSAKYTPFHRLDSWHDADRFLKCLSAGEIDKQAQAMYEQMRYFYPDIEEYKIVGNKLAVRALPRSGSDSRLVQVMKNGRNIAVRAGKLDAVIQAEKQIKDLLCS